MWDKNYDVAASVIVTIFGFIMLVAVCYMDYQQKKHELDTQQIEKIRVVVREEIRFAFEDILEGHLK